jgi:hypothetical protein
MMIRWGLYLALVLALCMPACGEKDDATNNAAAGGESSGAAQWNEAQIKKIGATSIDGFEVKKNGMPPRKDLANVTYVRTQKNAAGSQVQVNALSQGCMMCKKMDLAEWKANKHLRKGTENAKLVGSPGHVWELFEIEFGKDQKAMATYDLGYLKKDRSTFQSNKMKVFYNDGTNMVTLTVGLSGFSRGKSVDELKKNLSKQEMVDASKKVLTALHSHF